MEEEERRRRTAACGDAPRLLPLVQPSRSGLRKQTLYTNRMAAAGLQTRERGSFDALSDFADIDRRQESGSWVMHAKDRESGALTSDRSAWGASAIASFKPT